MQRKVEIEKARRRVEQARQQWDIARRYLEYVQGRPHHEILMNEFRAIASARLLEFENESARYRWLKGEVIKTSYYDLPDLPLVRHHITQLPAW